MSVLYAGAVGAAIYIVTSLVLGKSLTLTYAPVCCLLDASSWLLHKPEAEAEAASGNRN